MNDNIDDVILNMERTLMDFNYFNDEIEEMKNQIPKVRKYVLAKRDELAESRHKLSDWVKDNLEMFTDIPLPTEWYLNETITKFYICNDMVRVCVKCVHPKDSMEEDYEFEFSFAGNAGKAGIGRAYTSLPRCSVDWNPEEDETNRDIDYWVNAKKFVDIQMQEFFYITGLLTKTLEEKSDAQSNRLNDIESVCETIKD